MTDVKEEEHLLLRILPEQVSDKWDKFAPLIEKSLPPTVTQRRQRMANILRAILMEDLVAWVYLNDREEWRYVATTLIRTDEVSLTKSLMLYTFTSIGQVAPKELLVGINKLKTYGESNGCTSVCTYVGDPSVQKFLESQGFSTDYTFAQMMI